MSIIDGFTKKVTSTAKAVTKKSGDIVEVTKLNMSIGTEEEKIQKAYLELGKSVYEAYKKGETVGTFAKENCDKIKSYEESIKEIKQKILELKRLKLCPNCEVELEFETAFCPKCGTKQEVPAPEEVPQQIVEQPKVRICASCNSENTEEAGFCTKCGAKLE